MRSEQRTRPAVVRLPKPAALAYKRLMRRALHPGWATVGCVLALLPPIYALRNREAYRTWGMRIASLGIAWLAALWLLERALGVDLVPIL